MLPRFPNHLEVRPDSSYLSCNKVAHHCWHQNSAMYASKHCFFLAGAIESNGVRFYLPDDWQTLPLLPDSVWEKSLDMDKFLGASASFFRQRGESVVGTCC